MYTLRFHPDPADFERSARAFLLRHETENNLFFGIVGAIARGDYARFWLASLWRDGQLVGCALQTPPFPVLVTGMPVGALRLLVDALLQRRPALEGINGSTAMTEAFRELWLSRMDVTATTTMSQGLYELTRVCFPSRPAPGTMRPVCSGDVPLLEGWVEDFHRETRGPARAENRALLQSRIAEGSLFVWEFLGEPVAMAGWGGLTPEGVRINIVYTPPAQRGQGYASVLVAQLSQQLLDGGRRRCFLYTDLDNATSNGVYRRLGYQLVGEGQVITFAPSALQPAPVAP